MAAPRKKATAAQARSAQHPATLGHPQVEVAKRSADSDRGDRYVKEFVVLRGAGWEVDDDGSEAHVANKAGTAQEAIQRGLHPRGDVSFDGATDHDDGTSLVLTYSVAVVPASVDHEAQKTTTPRDVTEGKGG